MNIRARSKRLDLDKRNSMNSMSNIRMFPENVGLVILGLRTKNHFYWLEDGQS